MGIPDEIVSDQGSNFEGLRRGGHGHPRTPPAPPPPASYAVRSFLGLAGHYRKFIPNFSERAAVLTDQTKGKNPSKVQWNITRQLAFQDLKAAMQNQPVLRPPQWEDEFVLQVDASNRGLGAILRQKDQEGEEHPIAYASRKL